MKRIILWCMVVLLCLLAFFQRKQEGLDRAAECLVDLLEENEACAALFGLEDKGEWV